MTILAPILMAAIIIVPTLIMTNQSGEFKKIAVIEDNSDLFKGVIKNTKDAEFVYLENTKVDDLKKTFEKAGYYGILYISPELVNTPNAVYLISKKQPPIGLLQYIESSLKKEIERQKLLAYKIENLDDIMKNVETNVSVQTKKLDESGVEKGTSTGIAMALAYLLGFLMYMLVFIFGAQVMRGVIEEKTSRVVEVIISSVKPVQLMMGKIIGIALVGLTQFLIWIFLTVGIVTFLKTTILPKSGITEISQSMPQNLMAGNTQAAGSAKDCGNVTPACRIFKDVRQCYEPAMGSDNNLFYLLFYYRLSFICSVFAAIGSAVDNETETQQFMLPVTIPIILGLMVAMGTMQNPESSLSFWCSMIPLTSPIVMMARIPFGVPVLADSSFNGNNAGNFCGIRLDGSQSLPDRYSYVW